MPRYLVRRTFPDGLHIPMNDEGAAACLGVVDRNTADGVTWLHSYVTPDKQMTFCIYDGARPRGDPPHRDRQRSPQSTASRRCGSSTPTSMPSG